MGAVRERALVEADILAFDGGTLVPNRVLKESLLTSQTTDKLSVPARWLLIGMILTADDYGRFDADPRVLLAKCFPLRVGRISVATVTKWRDEIAAVGTIRLYEREDRLFGYFPKWFSHQRPARSRSKFPPPAKGEPPQDVGVDGEGDHNAVSPTTIAVSPQPTQTRSANLTATKYLLPATSREAGSEKREAGSESRENVKKASAFVDHLQSQRHRHPGGLRAFGQLLGTVPAS